MNMNTEIVNKKIKQYFDKEVTKNELIEWAQNSFHELLLSGEILEIEKLVVFRFLTRLADSSCSCEPFDDNNTICERTINEIWDILNGKINKVYSFHMKIPLKYIKNNVSKVFKIYEILLKYKEQRTLPKSKLVELEFFYDNTTFNIANRVDELLEVQMSNLLHLGYIVDYDDSNNPSELVFRSRSSVFMHTTDLNAMNEDEYLSRIFQYLSCCMGDSYFCVRIEFEGGLYNVSLIV